MKKKKLRAVIKKDRIRNTNIILELWMDEIKNDIEKSRIRLSGHVMQLREERISKKLLHRKMEGKCLRGGSRSR